jgi:hypothetical protein
LKPDLPPCLFDDIFGNVEAQARPFCLIFNHIITPEKLLKNLALLFFGNTHAVVPNAKDNSIVSTDYFYFNPAPFDHVFDGIIEKIFHYQLYPFRVAGYFWYPLFVSIELYNDISGSGQRGKILYHSFRYADNIHCFLPKNKPFLINPSHVQKIIDQSCHPAAQITVDLPNAGTVSGTLTFLYGTEGPEVEVYVKGAADTAANLMLQAYDFTSSTWTKNNMTLTAAGGLGKAKADPRSQQTS